MINLIYFGWVGMILTLLAFAVINSKKLEKTFFPLNALAAIFLVTYEFSISAWPIFGLHSFILVTSLIKSYRVFKN
jgi:hypothetical protein